MRTEWGLSISARRPKVGQPNNFFLQECADSQFSKYTYTPKPHSPAILTFRTQFPSEIDHETGDHDATTCPRQQCLQNAQGGATTLLMPTS